MPRSGYITGHSEVPRVSDWFVPENALVFTKWPMPGLSAIRKLRRYPEFAR
jgi:hypothetical protein